MAQFESGAAGGLAEGIERGFKIFRSFEEMRQKREEMTRKQEETRINQQQLERQIKQNEAQIQQKNAEIRDKMYTRWTDLVKGKGLKAESNVLKAILHNEGVDVRNLKDSNPYLFAMFEEASHDLLELMNTLRTQGVPAHEMLAKVSRLGSAKSITEAFDLLEKARKAQEEIAPSPTSPQKLSNLAAEEAARRPSIGRVREETQARLHPGDLELQRIVAKRNQLGEASLTELEKKRLGGAATTEINLGKVGAERLIVSETNLDTAEEVARIFDPKLTGIEAQVARAGRRFGIVDSRLEDLRVLINSYAADYRRDLFAGNLSPNEIELAFGFIPDLNRDKTDAEVIAKLKNMFRRHVQVLLNTATHAEVPKAKIDAIRERGRQLISSMEKHQEGGKEKRATEAQAKSALRAARGDPHIAEQLLKERGFDPSLPPLK